MSWAQLIGFCGYLLIVAIILMGTLWLKKQKRRGRFPLGADVRVLRQPGETLHRELIRLDERLFHEIAIALFLPAILGILPILLKRWLPWAGSWGLLISAAALAVVGLVTGAGQLRHLFEQMRNTSLGLYGERVVADQLEELKGRGYSVFHDVPCQGAAGMFNLDHVVVGCGAVAVVETKTRSKKTSVEGGKDHEVTYDGQQLLWPAGASTDELRQVIQSSDWLARRLEEKLNVKAILYPVLVIPGWMVKVKAPRPVIVLNQKQLVKAVTYQCKGGLTAAEEDLIKRHLRDLCSDVSFADI